MTNAVELHAHPAPLEFASTVLAPGQNPSYLAGKLSEERMNPSWREPWAEALESGRYHQGAHWLRQLDGTTDRHDVIGVLCDLFDDTKWYPFRAADGTHVWGWGAGDVFSAQTPHGVLMEPNSSAPTPRLSIEAVIDLQTRNDQGESFTSLAAYIREHV